MEIRTLSVIGLGYVGLPIAAAFAKKGFQVIAYDCNANKINQYKNGVDPTNEIGSKKLKKLKNILFTHDASRLKDALFHIIAVPTPVDQDNQPDLKPLIDATCTIAKYLQPQSIVVYESTVYPGTTEEVCVPILEKESGLSYIKDFNVGYSPERINPGDDIHKLENITKIISASSKESLKIIKNTYESIIKSGTFEAASIKVAEAAKLIENCQRDVNIALINEAAMVLNQMNISIFDVIDAANTKWNFQAFFPGLVGGHCISVDPYYFINKADLLNVDAKVMKASRLVNESMTRYISNQVIELLKREYGSIEGLNVLLMGITFKENVPDLRNTKVVNIVNQLEEQGLNVHVTDPIADREEVYIATGKCLTSLEDAKDLNVIIMCVAHDIYRSLSLDQLKKYYGTNKPIFIDIKGIYNREDKKGFNYWQL